MKFHSLNLIFLMIRYILIIILTLGNLCEIPMAAPLCFEWLYWFWFKSILKSILLKFHWLGLMFSMILFVLIIILTSGSSGASSMAAPYVLKDFIDFDLNLYFKQFWWNFICWAYVFNDLICFDHNLDFRQFWWSFSGCTLCFEGFYWF